jgi:1,4-alpha-glucan branching enzyme
LKNFIQTAHQQGFVVLLDMVLNHAFGQSPMVKMYFENGKPTAESPWFNVDATHPFNVGYDFNHESKYTQAFVDSVNTYWLKEYHFDGYRFDLSKGFTQRNNPTDVGAWSARDDSRIALLKRMADKIRETDESAYIILEHFADASEENELKADGMMVWGNSTYDYGDLLTGNISANINSAKDLNRVSYMESHDEERLMVKALNSSAKSTTYSVANELTALNRVKLPH